MGIMDFFKKGKEEPVKQQPANTPRPASAQPSQTPPASTSQNAPAASTPRAASPASAAPREYTIKSGDSLSKIAKQFYGNATDWQKIYQANKDKIKDPNLIHPGQKIVIP